MPWIDWIEKPEATDRLRRLYERYGSEGDMDHILKIHSLNPESLEGHYRYYVRIMKGPSGLSRAEREMIAVAVSRANDCFY